MFNTLIRKLIGTRHERERRRLQPLVDEINEAWQELRELSDEDLKAKTVEFRARLAEGEALDDLLPEAFAVVKEACRRNVGRQITVTGQPMVWDMVPYDVQLIGGIVLHQGRIAEMATGEGKTLVATLPVYLNALAGKGVHLVTVNDYLARRDAEWMGTVYEWLGLSVGIIQHDLPPDRRREEYAKDVTYGTNNEFGFDYLRDNMALALEHRVQRGHNYAIVDEVDSVLIDEARTPLIISGPTSGTATEYDELKPRVEDLIRAQGRAVTQLVSEAQRLLGNGDSGAVEAPEEEVTGEVDEEPEDEGDEPVDTGEGRYDAGIRLLQASRGLPKHKRLMKALNETGVKRLVQKVEADFMREKRLHELDEDLFFAMDEKGHNVHLSEKGLELLSPKDPNLFVVPDLSEALHAIDEDPTIEAGEKARRRIDLERDYAERSERIHAIHQLLKAYVLYEKDVEYVVQDGKVLIVDEFTGRLMPGRRWSDGLHQAVEAKEGVKVEGETQTLATITLQNYFRMYEKLAGMTGTAETEEVEFDKIYKMPVSVIPTNRPVRRVDYDDLVYRTRREKYNAVIEEIAEKHAAGRPVLVGTVSVEVSETLSRMLKRRGIRHHVLNAKYHQQEAEIVARAGQPGAVTIATNMAGRGTDIKLGPGVVRCTACAVWHDPDRDPDEGVGDNLPEGWTVGDCERDMPCGLHIIGTERHEARRIDRQLRGRSGRQGDPGSSLFFLSLEDDLMRLFGSERIAGIMDRLGAEEGEVITHGLVTRSIERAQKKVELQNFETRKRLLEYDDVMNQQRTVIYDLRLSILEAHDLEGTAREMIAEAADKVVAGHVEEEGATEDGLRALKDELLRQFLLLVEDLETAALDMSPAAVTELVREKLEAAFAQRLELWGPERAPFLLQRIMLGVIDEKWKEHLFELDHVKAGINYRAWGQKDPLIEYKKEAFEMFVEMLDDIHATVASLLFKAQIVETPPRVPQAGDRGGRGRRAPAQQLALQHGAPSPFAPPAQQTLSGPEERAAALGAAAPRAGAGESPFGGAPAPGPRRPVSVDKTPGRNAPCPCGSGKKYKLCHGR
ncbi:MAG TPA: preprotein translocase subunit SecA [Gemmatimonadota bacterium]|jgi:preprotein translocase subunit SecA